MPLICGSNIDFALTAVIKILFLFIYVLKCNST